MKIAVSICTPKTLGLLALISLFAYATGCADKKVKLEDLLDGAPAANTPDLPTASGGLVISVGGETIASDELIQPLLDPFQKAATSLDFEQFKKTATPQVEQLLLNRMTGLLLYQKAEREAGENLDEMLDRAVESEIREFVMGFGGDYAKAEAVIKQKGMNWKDFRDYQKKLILSQSYISEKMPKNEPIAYHELRNYYDSIKNTQFTTEAQIEFQLIDIQPKKLALTDPNADPDQMAAQLAKDLSQQIRDGRDFAELAKKYSNGHRASSGGAWPAVNPGSLATPYDKLAANAADMMPGQVSEPILAQDHVFIMKLVKKQDHAVQSFEKVQKQLESMIMIDKRKAAIEKLSRELASQAGLDDKTQFLNYCVEQIYWQCNNRL